MDESFDKKVFENEMKAVNEWTVGEIFVDFTMGYLVCIFREVMSTFFFLVGIDILFVENWTFV